MTVKYSERAHSHLLAIRAYLLEHAPEYVSHVMEGLLDKIDSLENMPWRGRPVPELLEEGGDVREVYFSPYRVSYLIEGQNIYVLAVQHQRQKRRKLKTRGP